MHGLPLHKHASGRHCMLGRMWRLLSTVNKSAASEIAATQVCMGCHYEVCLDCHFTGMYAQGLPLYTGMHGLPLHKYAQGCHCMPDRMRRLLSALSKSAAPKGCLYTGMHGLLNKTLDNIRDCHHGILKHHFFSLWKYYTLGSSTWQAIEVGALCYNLQEQLNEKLDNTRGAVTTAYQKWPYKASCEHIHVPLLSFVTPA